MVQCIQVSFLLIKGKINRKGFAPIRCRIAIGKNRKDFNSGLFSVPSKWNADLQVANDSSDNSLYINTQLKFIKQQLENEFLKLSLEGEVCIEKLYNSYRGVKKEEYTLIDALKKYQIRYSKLIGLDITRGTWRKYEQTIRHISIFLNEFYKKKDIPINSLALKFLNDFDFYLKTELGLKQNTINKSIQRFRKMLRFAISEEMLLADPFLLFKPRIYRKEIVYLDKQELDKLVKYKFKQDRLQKVKDCFVFCCYTGLAYKEMSMLKAANIVIGVDDKEWISIVRQKTGRDLLIPILPTAKKILSKYSYTVGDHLLPVISNQKFNSYIKEIAEILGIDKQLTHHIARKTFATTVLLLNDVPIEIVSELLGHSNVMITQKHYGKIVKKKLGEHMTRVGDKLNS